MYIFLKHKINKVLFQQSYDKLSSSFSEKKESITVFDIFNTPLNNSISQRLNPQFEYIRKLYQNNIATVVNYYHTRVYAVKNQNFLVRLLTHVDTPLYYDTEQFVEVTRTRSPYIAKAFKLTSEIEYGVLHNGYFFGNDTDEVIIFEDSYFNIDDLEKNWRNISAIRVLYHNKSDLGFMLMNGKVSGTETGLSFITINIPMLALQLRCFYKEQMLRFNKGLGHLGITHFVHMYVLPNILQSYTDLILFNRMCNILYDKDNGIALFKHAFSLSTQENKLYDLLVYTLNDYYDTNIEYTSLLYNLPSISKKNMFYSLYVPDLAPTRQLFWALFISRLKVMKFIIDLGGERGIARNKHYINDLKRDIRRLKNGAYVDILTYEHVKQINDTFDWMLSI